MLTAEYDETNRGDVCEPQKSVDWYGILTTDAMNNWSTYQNPTLTAIDGLSMKYTTKSSIY